MSSSLDDVVVDVSAPLSKDAGDSTRGDDSFASKSSPISQVNSGQWH